MKRGISPLIAVVLIVAFVIILAIIIVSWLLNTVGTAVSQQECAVKGQELCDDLRGQLQVTSTFDEEEGTVTVSLVYLGEDPPTTGPYITLFFKDENDQPLETLAGVVGPVDSGASNEWGDNGLFTYDWTGVNAPYAKYLEIKGATIPILEGKTCEKVVCLAAQHREEIEGYVEGWEGETYLMAPLIGAVTSGSAKMKVVNRDTQNVDIRLDYGNLPETKLDIPPNGVADFDLINLPENTQVPYTLYYRPTGTGEYQEDTSGSFFTKRASGESFNFVVFSDTHIRSIGGDEFSRCTDIMNRIEQEPNVDFSFALGDNIDDVGSETYQELYLNYRECLEAGHRSIAHYLTIGNHDGENGEPIDPEEARTARKEYIPNPSTPSIEEDYYSFTWGDALFIVLNVMSYSTGCNEAGTCDDWTLGQEQYDWLIEKLEEPQTTKWKFIFIHHPVGGNGRIESQDMYGRGGGRAAYVGEQFDIHKEILSNDYSQPGTQTIFFYGHDHVFFDMVVDGVHYSLPSDAGKEGGNMFAYASGYKAMGLPDWLMDPFPQTAGYALVSVNPSSVTVTYKGYRDLTEDETWSNNIYDYTLQDTETDSNPPQFNSVPEEQLNGEDLDIIAEIQDPESPGTQLKNVILYYKKEDESRYNLSHIPCETDCTDNRYKITIGKPGNIDFTTEKLDYFIRAEDDVGNSIHAAIIHRISTDMCIRKTASGYTNCEDNGRYNLYTGKPGALFTYRSFIDFDTSLIPAGVNIQEIGVSLKPEETTDGSPTIEIKEKDILGQGLGLPTIYDGMDTSTTYATQSYSPLTGLNTVDLGQLAVNQFNSHSSWFSLAFKEDDEAVGEMARPGGSEVENALNAPRLMVTYTIV